ncbi:hypothetical protein [Flagellimonas okinawensis]|uniref:Uncharacterized protein n=1 Tax=Flagellimonas okinawensis TaxID=3031324 RepID=A0ABT5XLP3_9FLAO|nr:hypothetical protein [[Muricauda] okinawensis]MDF0706806.1 hypothetical protein [[Muricauda] okinawensis]
MSNSFQVGFIIDFLSDETHHIFEVSGDPMNDNRESIPNKSYVLGWELIKESLVRNKETLRNQSYIIVCNGIICKQIIGYNKERRTLMCHNLNTSPEFRDFELPLNDVLQIFKTVKEQLLPSNTQIEFNIWEALSKTSLVFAKQNRRNFLS